MDMKISQKHLCFRENTLGSYQSKYRSYNPLESIITYYVSLTKNLENGTLCRLFPTCRLLKMGKMDLHVAYSLRVYYFFPTLGSNVSFIPHVLFKRN